MMAPSDDRTIRDILTRALAEDLGERGDVTSSAIFEPGRLARAVIRSKASGVLAGSYLVKSLFALLDKRLRVRVRMHDGDVLSPGSVICELHGPIRAILAGERTILNLLQRLSGIATHTNTLVKRIRHTTAVLLDTRKTTPNLRLLEKRAVVAGGGTNHRFGLYDMVLIKDTHVKAAGGVAPALRAAREHLRKRSLPLRIEVEVQSIAEFRVALSLKPDVIMLDNMSVSRMGRCVVMRDDEDSAVRLEASGNVAADTIGAIAATGVDYISVGCITHSAAALDLHLLILPGRTPPSQTKSTT